MPRATRPTVQRLEDRTTLTAGATDYSYGNGGVADIVGLNTVVAAAAGPDGSLYVLGGVYQGSGTSEDPTTDFGVVKLTPAGQPDTSFGANGLARIGFDLLSGRGADLPQAIVVQDDGMIVVGGVAVGPTPTKDQPSATGNLAVVARLRPNGALDPQFGTGFSGKVVIAFTNPVPTHDSTTNSEVLVNRYVDFNSIPPIKMAVLPFSHDVVVAAVVRGDYLYGTDGFHVAVAPAVISTRLNSFGIPVETYGKNGVSEAFIDPGRYVPGGDGGPPEYAELPLAIGPDGSIYVAYASTRGEFAPLHGTRISPLGVVDGTYGGGGQALLGDSGKVSDNFSLDLYVHLFAGGDGRLLMVQANEIDHRTAAVRRFTANGAQDSGFGGSGVVSLSFGTNPQVTSIDPAIDHLGRLVFKLSDHLFRLTPDGVSDPTFRTTVPIVGLSGVAGGGVVATQDDHYLVYGPLPPYFLFEGKGQVGRVDGADNQNTPPSITPPPAKTLAFGPVSDPAVGTSGRSFVSVGVRDNETPNGLTLTTTSSNPALLPNPSIGTLIGGIVDLGLNPVAGQAGTATITVTVADVLGATAQTSFFVTVNPDGSGQVSPVPPGPAVPPGAIVVSVDVLAYLPSLGQPSQH